MPAERRGVVVRRVVCVVESWGWALCCGVVFSGGFCLLDSGGLSSLRAVKRRRRRSSWKFHVAIGVTSISPERVDLPRCCNLLLNEFQKFRRVSMSMTME